MKKHGLLLSLCSVVSTAILLHVLFSCAQKQQNDEELSEAEASEIISEEGSTEETASTGSSDNAAELESTVDNKDATGEALPPTENLASNEGTTSEAIPEPAGKVPEAPPDVTAAQQNAAFKRAVRATVPKIPGKALDKKGVRLNRFYFVRQGDNAKSVAQLVYGDPSKGKALQAWNPGAWKAGRLIYYASTTAPDDLKMQSFYQERNVPFETYVVGPKESLTAIAKKKLGATASWKEIAVLNGIDSINGVEPGQKLEIHPNLKGLPPAAVAIKPKEPPPQVQAPVATPDPRIGEPPPVAETNPPPPPQTHSAPAGEEGGGNDIMNLITQNLFPIVIGAAVLVLLVLLVAVSKRKKKNSLSDDFPEDGFSAPPKLKKRK